jgi:hypothetical protein
LTLHFFADIGDLEPPIDELNLNFHIDIPFAWFVTTLYNANAIAMPTELAMQIWMAFAMMSASFMLLYLRVKIPKVVGAERLLVIYDSVALVCVLAAVQLVADILTSVVAF